MAKLFGAGLILFIIGFWWVAGIWAYRHGGKFSFSRMPRWIRLYGQSIVAVAATLVIYLMVDTTLAFVALT